MKNLILKSALLLAAGVFMSQATFAKSLTIYFSRADENYGVGYVKDGNTAKLAKIIAEKTGSDLHEISPVTAYPKQYKAATEVARTEKENNARPDYKTDLVSVDEYDTVYIGSPVWWGDMPMVMYTFLEKNSLDGKKIYPFVTHEGSGLSAIDLRLQSMFKMQKLVKL